MDAVRDTEDALLRPKSPGARSLGEESERRSTTVRMEGHSSQMPQTSTPIILGGASGGTTSRIDLAPAAASTAPDINNARENGGGSSGGGGAAEAAESPIARPHVGLGGSATSTPITRRNGTEGATRKWCGRRQPRPRNRKSRQSRCLEGRRSSNDLPKRPPLRTNRIVATPRTTTTSTRTKARRTPRSRFLRRQTRRPGRSQSTARVRRSCL